MGKYALLSLTYYLNNTINLLIRARSYMESMALAFWVLIATEKSSGSSFELLFTDSEQMQIHLE